MVEFADEEHGGCPSVKNRAWWFAESGGDLLLWAVFVGR